MTGYKTYVLFGIDTRGEGSQYSAQNSDTMIIVSVNNDTKEVRMVSVYRDTLLNVGDDTYTKANAAYALGGPEQAITMLNTNLDLDISDYATADFSALVEVVDDLGGLDIPLSYAEIEHMNNYCVETSKLTGKDYTPIEKPEPKPEDEGSRLCRSMRRERPGGLSQCRRAGRDRLTGPQRCAVGKAARRRCAEYRHR